MEDALRDDEIVSEESTDSAPANKPVHALDDGGNILVDMDDMPSTAKEFTKAISESLGVKLSDAGAHTAYNLFYLAQDGLIDGVPTVIHNRFVETNGKAQEQDTSEEEETPNPGTEEENSSTNAFTPILEELEVLASQIESVEDPSIKETLMSSLEEIGIKRQDFESATGDTEAQAAIVTQANDEIVSIKNQLGGSDERK